MYHLRFMAPPQKGRAEDTWIAFKQRGRNQDPNEVFKRAIEKLAHLGWRNEHGLEGSDLHADLVPLQRAEGGVGNPEGPHIRMEMTHLLMMSPWMDIVFVFNGDGWTPERVRPYKIALQQVCQAEVGYEFECRLEVGDY